MFHGMMTIYKEAGYTSSDVVARLRGILHMRKIGHTGTLDPDAEGVLPVCLGKGTKLCELIADRDKEYVAVLRLGTVTDTQDMSGTVLRSIPDEEVIKRVTPEALEEAAAKFRGPIRQVPPMYSAVKIGGKRLYELARQGRTVERPAREVTIYELEIINAALPLVTLRVRCSKGTYIRTLCQDLGEELGTGGAMESLLRTRVGRFRLEEAIRLDDAEANYQRASDELHRMAELLRHGKKKAEPAGRLLGEVTPLFDRQSYCAMVERAKKHIREGDIFQIVLSNRLSAPFEGSLLNTYRVLRTINPSPYMFYFSGTDVEVAGASPETLVKLENGVLHTFPLAGTRPRGKTEQEDIALECELLADEKELAEHNMLVDLGRNDLGKISKFGTVEVEKLHSVERYSHVMHIGSTVRGEIRGDKDALDAIEAVLPAGTLSGAPKIRACQLIGALENNKRGIYGGAIGYIDFTGNMDTCIAIRIAYKKNGKVFVRSGAGIVADSNPDKEFEECLNKARASLRALELAQEAE